MRESGDITEDAQDFRLADDPEGQQKAGEGSREKDNEFDT